MRARVKRCKSCGARVIFAVSEHGNRMCVDASPVVPGETLDRFGRPIKRGNVRLVDRGARDKHGNPAPTAVVAKKEDAEPTLLDDGEPVLRVDHHTTCKFGDEYRRKRGNRG